MTCREARPLLHAYLDSELDLTNSLVMEQHLGECAECADRYSLLKKLRAEIADADLAYAPGPQLERKIWSQHRGTVKLVWWGALWQRMPLLVAASALLALVFVIPWRGSASFESELIDSHMRSLLAGHLVDVPSSDQHTVKPWFQGRINFSPEVRDLTTDGFPLVGGRLDVVGQKQTAAIIYKRREHVINLFIAAGESTVQRKRRNGYNVVAWSEGGMSYWAVSDLNERELEEFSALIRR